MYDNFLSELARSLPMFTGCHSFSKDWLCLHLLLAFPKQCCFDHPFFDLAFWSFMTYDSFGSAAAAAFSKILKFFLLKFNMVYMFWIVLMCWCQKWFLKNKKNIISIHFDTKIYLKNTRNYTTKHALNQAP
jgi:hypothetical protein